MTTKPASSVFEKMTDYEKTYRIKGQRETLCNITFMHSEFIQRLLFHAMWANLPISECKEPIGFMSAIMDWKLDIYTTDGYILLRGTNDFGARRGAVCVGEDAINLVAMCMYSKRPKGITGSSIYSLRDKANHVSPEEWKKHIEHIRFKDKLWKYYPGDVNYMQCRIESVHMRFTATLP